MASPGTLLAARGLTDHEDHLVSADTPVAQLQEACGGEIPGILAIPELLDLVRQSRLMGLRLAREFSAFDGTDAVTGFVRITPLPGEKGGGCELLIENWQRETTPSDDARDSAARMDAIDRNTAELIARLDAEQRVKTIDCMAADLAELGQGIRSTPGHCWSEFVDLVGITHRQPLHWRLLDGAKCRVPGSARDWRARLLPIGSTAEPRGFELLLVAEYPLLDDDDGAQDKSDQRSSLIGEALTPALREPIARIISNAETIRTRMAGPLRQEYTEYATDISSAGQHLMSLLDDLDDLEQVEAADFTTERDRIDLADAARRAAGILSGRSQDKGIVVVSPEADEKIHAIGEYRRVLQVLLNLLGNAIAYSPEGTEIVVAVEADLRGRATVSVTDQGPGLSNDQQQRIFKKFERLGREGDGGSGLGLYISQRLANSMDGELSIASQPGEGTRFALALPAAI